MLLVEKAVHQGPSDGLIKKIFDAKTTGTGHQLNKHWNEASNRLIRTVLQIVQTSENSFRGASKDGKQT